MSNLWDYFRHESKGLRGALESKKVTPESKKVTPESKKPEEEVYRDADPNRSYFPDPEYDKTYFLPGELRPGQPGERPLDRAASPEIAAKFAVNNDTINAYRDYLHKAGVSRTDSLIIMDDLMRMMKQRRGYEYSQPREFELKDAL